MAVDVGTIRGAEGPPVSTQARQRIAMMNKGALTGPIFLKSRPRVSTPSFNGTPPHTGQQGLL